MSFDKTKYIVDKIVQKLQISGFDVNKIQQTKDLLNKIKFDLVPINHDLLENSVVGWLTLCKLVQQLVSENKEINYDNFKEVFEFNVQNESRVQKKLKREETIYKFVENKEPDLEYLLSIADKDIIISDDFDLTEEGLREAQMIKSDETSLEGNEITVANTKEVVYIRQGEQIISPFTNSEIVYQIDSNTYMDLETGQEFIVKNVH